MATSRKKIQVTPPAAQEKYSIGIPGPDQLTNSGLDLLRESEEKFKYVFDHSPIGKSITAPSGEIQVNRAFCEMLGYSKDELQHRRWQDISHPDDIEATQAAIAPLLSGERDAARFIKRYLHKDGHVVWADVSTSLRRDGIGKPLYFMTNVMDITERRQAEEVLQKSQQLLNETQQITKVGGWEYDVATGRVVWTDEVYRIHGVSKDYDPGSPNQDIEFYAPEDQATLTNAFQRAVEKGEPYDLELQLINAQGVRLWVRTSGQAERKDGKIVRVFGNIMDITERKRANQELIESESRFRKLTNSLPQLVWTCQPDGPCDFLSQKWVSYTGVPEAQQLGYGWLEQLHPDDRAPTVTAWQAAAASGEDFHVEFRIRRHDGVYRWFDTQAVRLRDAEGRTVKWFGSNTDITERKRAEDELRNYHAHLEEMVRERTAALETANQDLESFAYSVSHDLRTPLRAIDGFSLQVLKRYEDKLDEEGRRYLNVVRDNTKKMSQLIDDILAFSRMGRLGMTMSEINMEELAHAVLKDLKPGLVGRELTMEIKPLPRCHGDLSMLRQVWVNLLANAIKFTRHKQAALVEVGGHTEGAENIYYVRDNGAGFDMQYADKLFGVFQRLHGVEEFEGTGIGLAIIKRIIIRHGGRVWAEGRVDEGATIYFALPTKENT